MVDGPPSSAAFHWGSVATVPWPRGGDWGLVLDVQLDDGRNRVSGGDLAKLEVEGHLHLFGVEPHVSLDSNLGASPQPQFSPSSGFWNFNNSNKNVLPQPWQSWLREQKKVDHSWDSGGSLTPPAQNLDLLERHWNCWDWSSKSWSDFSSQSCLDFLHKPEDSVQEIVSVLDLRSILRAFSCRHPGWEHGKHHDSWKNPWHGQHGELIMDQGQLMILSKHRDHWCTRSWCVPYPLLASSVVVAVVWPRRLLKASSEIAQVFCSLFLLRHFPLPSQEFSLKIFLSDQIVQASTYSTFALVHLLMMVISNTFMPALMHLLYLQLMQFLVSSVTRQLLVPDRHLEGIRDDHHWHHQLHHCSYHRHDCNGINTLAILLQLFFWCFAERKPYKSNSSGLRKKQIWKREICSIVLWIHIL